MAAFAEGIRTRQHPVARVDHVVSSSGPWWVLPALNTISADQYHRALAGGVHPHFYAWRHLSPLVLGRKHTSYSLITGAASLAPVTGLNCVTQTALQGLLKVIRHESASLETVVNEILLHKIVVDHEAPKPHGELSNFDFARVFAALARAAVTDDAKAPRGTQIAITSVDDVHHLAEQFGAFSTFMFPSGGRD